MRRALIAVMLAAISVSGALAAEVPAFVFSAGYHPDSAPVRDIVELGIVHRCGPDWCLRYSRFDSAARLPLVPTEHRHHMHAPTRAPNCTDGLIMTVDPGEHGDRKVRFERTAHEVTITTPELRYRWTLDDKGGTAYVLRDLSTTRNPHALDQVVGFAFDSRDVPGSVTRKAQLEARFHGDIFHKSADSGPIQPWTHAEPSIDFRRFAEEEDGAVLTLTEPGMPEINRRYGHDMWVDHAVLLKRPAAMAPIVEEYGHNFKLNGCFAEGGHNKLLLPATDADGRVVAFAYIEYTRDMRFPSSMISVGRYYR